MGLGDRSHYTWVLSGGGLGGGRLALLSGLKEDRGGDRRERRRRMKGGTAVTRMEHTGMHGPESAEKLLPAACDGGCGRKRAGGGSV